MIWSLFKKKLMIYLFDLEMKHSGYSVVWLQFLGGICVVCTVSLGGMYI
jgi:hypothetical protein